MTLHAILEQQTSPTNGDRWPVSEQVVSIIRRAGLFADWQKWGSSVVSIVTSITDKLRHPTPDGKLSRTLSKP